MGFSWEVVRHSKGQPVLSPNRVRVKTDRPPCRNSSRPLLHWVRFAPREAPPIAMQPARSLLCVLVPARRLDACAAILSEHLRQTIADLGVARAGKLIERNRTQEPRGELVGSAPLYQKHATACIRHRHRKNQSTVRAQTVEPGRQRMGRPGARHNDLEHSKAFGPPRPRALL